MFLALIYRCFRNRNYEIKTETQYEELKNSKRNIHKKNTTTKQSDLQSVISSRLVAGELLSDRLEYV